MADAEIEVIREILVSHPRPTDLSERRKRLDALGAQYPLPPDVRVEPVEADGVAAEWTTTPQADPAHAIMFLHGGGYISGSIDSHRYMIAQTGREARARTLALGYRLTYRKKGEHDRAIADFDQALCSLSSAASDAFRGGLILNDSLGVLLTTAAK
jgi:acetyl esterase/lipase